MQHTLPTSSQCSLNSLVRHAFLWLVIANGIGLVMALLLLWPEWNRGPLTFARLAPLHMNLQLYGWCALPLIGLLFMAYQPDVNPSGTQLGRLALRCWSAALVVGAFSWLTGHTSGKLFLDWRGPALWLFCAAGVVLWIALLVGFVQGMRANRDSSRALRIARLIGLLLLLPVPAIQFMAGRPGIYPPVNPQSGGATGTSLVGSTLGVILIFLLLPALLRVSGQDRASGNRFTISLAGIYLLHLVWFALLPHANVSNREPGQIAAMASLVVWVPLIAAHYRHFTWQAGSGAWLAAFGAWALLLWADGFIAFLPGVLASWKFTHAMVAHAHLAMAGMVTAFAAVILNQLAPHAAAGLRSRVGFLMWNLGCMLYVAVMVGLGLVESDHPEWLFRGAGPTNLVFSIRLFAGLLMFIASLNWLLVAIRARSPQIIMSPAGAAQAASAGPVGCYS